MGKQFERGGNRGANRGGFSRGGGGGRGGRGGRGGFGGGRQNWDTPPSQVIEVGTVMHPCEEYLVVKHQLPDKVPIFGRPVYLENKTKIGMIDDVFGPINEFVS
jgi:H/ACA ribonucleoprotein complex subunit 1